MIKNIFLPFFTFVKDAISNSIDNYNVLIQDGNVNKFWGWTAILCLSIYVFLISLWNRSCPYFYFWSPFLTVLFFCFISKLFLFFSKIELKNHKNLYGTTGTGIAFVVFFSYLIILAFFGYKELWDTMEQMYQIESGHFNDWHPIIHTLTLYIFAIMCKRLCFILICSFAIFSVACGWLFSTMIRYKYDEKIAIFLIFLFAFSSGTISTMFTLFKDAAFATVLIGISTVMLHLWHTKGQWLCNFFHASGFALLLFYASFVRHNGIFFTIPILCFLPFLYKGLHNKIKAVSFSLIVCGILSGYIIGRQQLLQMGYITEPIHGYRLVQFQKTGNVSTPHLDQDFVESIGLPMCIMSEIFMKSPEKLSPEATALMLQIGPREYWEKLYSGSFNSVKHFSHRTVLTAFSSITPHEFTRIFFNTVKENPKKSFYAFLHTTSIVWWIDQPFTAPGFIILILLITGTYAFIKHGWCILFYITPFLAYTWGTALLLNGPDYRFFCGIMVGAVPICAMFLSKERNLTDK